MAPPPPRCAHGPIRFSSPFEKGDWFMVMRGVDAHKCSPSVVVEGLGQKVGVRATAASTTGGHLESLRWAARFGSERVWVVEDGRRRSRCRERDLFGVGERIVRVPPKVMGHASDAARTYGKSDPIDVSAVAQAALRHPDLLVARLDGHAREPGLLVDHREDLVGERTRCLNRLRWQLRELDPAWGPPARSRTSAPTSLETPGVGASTAGNIVAELADSGRFTSKDAFARHQGTAPLPVWSGNHERHRLSRTGNRQLDAAIHRIAVTQKRCHGDAKTDLERRAALGRSKSCAAVRC